MLPFRRKPKLSKAQALGAVPFQNPRVQVERDERGTVVLTLKARRTPAMALLSRIFFTPAQRRVALDPIGTWVWQRCDGKRSVRRLIDELARRYKLNPREAEISLTTFLRSLGQRGLVLLAVPKEGTQTEEASSEQRADREGRETD